MTGRRSHRKSKTGCISCKTRKVKCDENKPSCKNCVKHRVTCTYPPRKPVSPSSSPRFCGNANGLYVDFSTRIKASGLNVPMLDLQLLHHYSTSTCYTISQNPLSQNIWRIEIPKVGFSFDFVMEAVLTISALHLAHCKPLQKDFFIEKALQLHESALRTTNKLLLNINEDNCSAIYCVSTLTCLIACAKPRQSDGFLLVRETGLLEWLRLFRGHRSIIYSYMDTLHSGPLGVMFKIGRHRTSSWQDPLPEMPQPLQDLCRIMSGSVKDPNMLHVYISTIETLSRSLAIISSNEATGYSNEPAEIFIWLYKISDEYLCLLDQRSSEAMIILAYYCVCLKQLEWAWWMRGWSLHLITAIYHTLDHEHRCWIQWPIEQIGWVPP